MATESPDAERQWAAEKRDFVGDRRDDLAGERDLAGDLRDLTADAREQALDKRERELDAREAELGLARQAEATAHRLDAVAIRGQARQTRERSGAERVAAARARDEATQRRLEAAPITGLASAFATIAANLYAADSYDAVLQLIAEAAVSTVAGCQMASVTLSEHGAYRTASTTDVAASAVDQAQYDAQEGPCLDAVETTLVYAKSFPDNRWPMLASRPVDLGAHSVASYRLAAGERGERRHERLAQHLRHQAGRIQRRGAADRVAPGRARLDGRRGSPRTGRPAGCGRASAPGPVDPRCHRPGQRDPDGTAQAHPGGRLQHPASRLERVERETP